MGSSSLYCQASHVGGRSEIRVLPPGCVFGVSEHVKCQHAASVFLKTPRGLGLLHVIKTLFIKTLIKRTGVSVGVVIVMLTSGCFSSSSSRCRSGDHSKQDNLSEKILGSRSELSLSLRGAVSWHALPASVACFLF